MIDQRLGGKFIKYTTITVYILLVVKVNFDCTKYISRPTAPVFLWRN